MPEPSQERQVNPHYASKDLRARLAEALAAAGLADKQLTATDLAALDQFHTRGLAATLELAEAVGVVPGEAVIDVGSGLGGPSRTLAAKFGCRVHGVDLSAEFVEAATYLAERAGLADKVTYDCANALALPVPTGRFDLAWTQHVAMNIADRAALYGEIHRVLRPGGRLAIYDVVAGSGEALHFPVPWSRTPQTSFLLTPAAMRLVLEDQGFQVVDWRDTTDAAIAWFAQQPGASNRPPIGLPLAMGPDFPLMAANLGRNLREGRVGLIQAVLVRA